MSSYNSTITTQEEGCVLQVIWYDNQGNIIVSGEKKVKGGTNEAKKMKKAFADDLKKNFADLFPEPEPTPPDEELI